MDRTTETPVTLYFGRHKGKPLADIPAGYLRWALGTVKLSSGTRAALTAEMTRRGLTAPPPPEPPPVWPCRRCGPGVGHSFGWFQDRRGQRRVKRTCVRCGQSLGFCPLTPQPAALADAASCPTPVLDVLLEAERLGIVLVSDGRGVNIGTGWQRATAELKRKLDACRHDLARMLGKQRLNAEGP